VEEILTPVVALPKLDKLFLTTTETYWSILGAQARFSTTQQW